MVAPRVRSAFRLAMVAGLLLAAPGCPALLDDEFALVSPGPDASTGGSAGIVGGSGGGGDDDASASGGLGGNAPTGGSGGNSAGSDGGPIAGSGGLDGGDGGTCIGCEAVDCCDGVCVDRATNTNHCGACGVGCPGTTCSGSCSNTCAFTFLDCDRNSVTGCEINSASDIENCGSCGVRCPSNATCEQGRCVCPAGSADCDDDVDNGCEVVLESDANNCGACGKSCGANQGCTGSQCVCQPGFADCDTQADNGCEASLDAPATCGSCTKDCGLGSTCSSGSCGCAQGLLNCDVTIGCETSVSDPQNCGACTVACAAGAPVCNGVACVTGCTGTQTLCGSSCVELSSDPSHCGACNKPVGPHQTCVGGQIQCLAGFANCDGQPGNGCETDTTTDALHCGGCNDGCKPGAVCSASSCQCAASTPNDCGATCRQCCNASHCSDANPCTTDTCSASGTCTFSSQCTSGGLCCAQQGCFECCSDGNCTGGRVCSNGQCVLPSCVAPMILCGTQCVDPTTNASHCDGCNIDCGLGRTCVARQCTPPWVSTSVAPAGLTARSKAAYTFTNNEVFIWGGADAGGGALGSGALYNPAVDSWRLVASAPVLMWPRVLATAVWTGTVVVIWGGGDPAGTSDFQTGGVYDPATNTWKMMSLDQAPSARRAPRGVWTGSRVLFWGGWLRSGVPEDKAFLYDPNNDTWSQTSNSGTPPKLSDATSGFSGSSFFVYGGRPNGAGESSAFFRYQPATDAWAALAEGPSPRYGAFGAWDGSKFVVWGGRRGTGAPVPLVDGGRYDPSGGTWSSVTTSGAPSARHAAHRETGWAARIGGERTLFVGGYGGSPPLTEANVQHNGGIYNSTTNGWSLTPTWPSGETHLWGVAVWTGSELVLWGGLVGGVPTKTGERFRP
jgi:hypothetical protein